MKKIIPIIVILLTTPLFGLFGIDVNARPSAQVVDQAIESISIRDINLLFDIEITNPYPIGLKFSDVEFVFHIEKKQLFKTNTGKGLKIKKKGKQISQFRVNLKYEDIYKIVKDYSNKEYLDCKIDMKLVIPLPEVKPLPKDFTFKTSISRKLPAIKPTISVDNFKIKKPSVSDIESTFKKSGKDLKALLTGKLSGKKTDDLETLSEIDIPINVDFDIVMKNNSKAKLAFANLNYDFFVENDKLVGGETKDIVSKDNKSILRISNKFSSKTLSTSIIKAFKDGRGGYKLKGETKINVPDQKKPATFVFDEAGSFNSN